MRRVVAATALAAMLVVGGWQIAEATPPASVGHAARPAAVAGAAGITLQPDVVLVSRDVVAKNLVGTERRGRTFRFRAVADRADGTAPENFEAGELDDAGRIATVLTFPGTLA